MRRNECEFYENSFYEFVKGAWNSIEPNEFQDGWHIKFLCDHLQAVYEDKINNLLINIPPGYGKSLIVSVLFPAWCWTKNPSLRFLTGSKGFDLSIRDCRKSRILFNSDWYQEKWSKLWSFSSDENQKSSYENDKGGFRNVFSTGGNVTGFRGDIRLIDDPHDASETYNIDALKKTCEWYGGTFSTRTDQLKPSKTIIIMQRLSPADLSGFLLETQKELWVHICLPLEYEPERKCRTILGEDPRKIAGELLWDKISQESVKLLKANLGLNGIDGQLQQRPNKLDGNIIKISWFKYYNPEFIKNFDCIYMSVDGAWETKKENDYSVCTVWGVIGDNYYLIDMWRDKVIYPDFKVMIKYLNDKYFPFTIIIEDAASGKAFKQEMQSSLGVHPFKPEGDKVARVYAISDIIAAGRVFLPKSDIFPENYKWVYDFITEVSGFPKSEHDDIVDTLSQFLRYMATMSLTPLTIF